MLPRIPSSLIVLMLLILPIAAHAQAGQLVTFTYVGQNFTNVSGTGPLNPNGRITISITLKVNGNGNITMNSVNGNSELVAWSMSDGVYSFSNVDSSNVSFGLDYFTASPSANGFQVFEWDIELNANNVGGVPTPNTLSLYSYRSFFFGFTDEDSSTLSYPMNGYNQVASYTSGTWTTTNGPAPSIGKSNGNPYDCQGGIACGEPINVGTGNVYYEITDYETTGPNKLRFVRYYNSRAQASIVPPPLGQNWRSDYDRSLTVLSDASVSVVRADGRGLQFALSGNNWVTDSDVGLTLTQSGSTWTLTDTDDTVETYSPVGSSSQPLLTSIRSRNGYTQTLNYDANNVLVSVTDSYNRMLTFTYQNGLLQTVTTPDGLVLTYGYDDTGDVGGLAVLDRLRTITYSTTPQTSQSYLYGNANLPLALTGITDENGNQYASWTYDQNARGLSSQFGMGANLTTVVYNDTDGSRTVTNSLGQQEVYHFTILQGIPKVTEIDRQPSATTAAATKTFTYDGNGYLASESDWNGNTTLYVNDSLGRPTSITEASGTPNERTTTISYFQNFHLPAQIVAPNLTSTFVYDATPNLLTKTLTDTTTTSVPYVTTGQTRTWTYTWADGLLTSVQNPRQDVAALTSFSYDGSGTLVKITNALGQTIQVTQHTPGGLPLQVVDANGVVNGFSYDARLRLTGRAVSTAAGVLTTQTTYDLAGNLLVTTLPDGSALTNSYDTAHRLTGVTDLFRQTMAYTLDAAGDPTLVRVADSSGTVRRQHAGAFDALARLITDQGGAGQTTHYSYDNNDNLLVVTDPLGHAWMQAYDVLNRRIQATDPANGTTQIAYDVQDHPLSVAAPNAANTSYVYDGFGEVIEKVSPDSGTTLYVYDADGNLIRRMDATGAIANFTYDALDRVTSTTYPGDPSENISYDYDQSGHGFGIGRLTSVWDAAGALNRSYDERGNVVSEVRSIGTTMLHTAYTYDLASRITSILYPSGTLVTYLRDAMGRTTSVTAKAPGATSVQTIASQIGYLPFGPVNALVFGNGIGEARSFDGDYRLTQILAQGTQGVQSLSYGYDGADNVRSITDAVTPQNSQSFSYDALDRLTGASGGYGSLAYMYDSVGNRLTQNAGGMITTYSYAPNSNRLATIQSGGAVQTVGYTAAGNISATGSSANVLLSYNQSGRLASVNSGARGIAQYSYDAFGKRLEKTALLSGKTLYQYDLQGHLLEETGIATTPPSHSPALPRASLLLTIPGLPITPRSPANETADYIYLDDGRLIATLSPNTGTLDYIHGDHLGTPQLATNKSQAAVWSTAYMPFGQTGAVAGTITQNLRLPGQYFDSETGWHQNGFRDYVPALGRYLETDPIGLAGGLNTYAYVGQNPTKGVDQYGLGEGFVFVSYEPHKPGISLPVGRLGSEVVWLDDYSSDTGWSSGGIAAVGGSIRNFEGDEFFGYYKGIEKIKGRKSECITLHNADPRNIPIIGNYLSKWIPGVGYYTTSDQYGVFLYKDIELESGDISIGFGFPISGIVSQITNSSWNTKFTGWLIQSKYVDWMFR